ncbi:MAG: DUF4394 domain-containing protein [Oculatellaceae cyanobacterium bins.114]|nr:DUF4394 domain-containing protein [Oculatellaceae cyanobacterium bins.114]
MNGTAYVFIDRAVQDYSTLVAHLKPGYQAVVLESDRDGITQISEVLQTSYDVTEVHVVAHGSPGCLQLGNTQINLANLQHYATSLSQWRQVLVQGADLVLYGCRLAEQGWNAFSHILQNLTGANIAASSQTVGNGQWNFDRSLGNVKATVAFTPALQQSYTGTFAIGYVLSNNSLITFDTTNPDSPNAAVPITGVVAGESLVGIDFRPQNGRLYGLARDGAGAVRLYAISPQTGVATPLTAAPVQLTVDGVNPAPITGTNFGVDFNPTVDRFRVVTDGGFNFRMNPNTGALIDGNAVLAGVNPDGTISGASTTVDATAYTNNAPNVTVTTQYTLDAVSNQLLIQNPPNNGTQTAPLPVTLNGSPLDFTAVNGFDIPAGVNVTTSNTAATGRAIAALTVGGTTGLYGIELSTGVATALGTLGTGSLPVQGFAIQNDTTTTGTPLISLSSNGASLLRFSSATPGTVVTTAITGVPAGETVVGIDFRPATGQLFALSVNATADTGSVLILDPQTGAATVVGTPGQVAFVDGVGAPIDLPDPATAGYGIDFNPTVDRIRVVTSSGLNFRLNPITGAPVDGNVVTAGINPDSGVNGAATGVDATAYTNNFGGATTTTQYTLDSVSNRLLIQNPPNNGTQTAALAVTLNGTSLDFTAVNGFDIPSGVQVTTSNTPATGRGLAALTVGGVNNLYAIELSTGAATLLGAIGAGTAGSAGLTAAEAPVGAVAFGAATYTVAENGGAIAINLVRTGGSSGNLSVNLTATGGTATATTDFTGTPITVTFADGQTTATANLAITDDAISEAAETVSLALASPTNGAVLAAQDIATLTIADNDLITVRGTGRNDRLRGGNTGDLLLGLAGNDRLLGLGGDDSLNGGLGSDVTAGGRGADRFIYSGRTQQAALANSLVTAPDQIFDFKPGEGDRIVLDFDNRLATANLPRGLFNSGRENSSLLVDAARSAYADKDQRTTGNQGLRRNEAVLFSWRGGTYLSVNDNRAGFSATSDLVVNVTRIGLQPGDARAGVLTVANYFA